MNKKIIPIECFTTLCIDACDGLEKYIVSENTICTFFNMTVDDFCIELEIPLEHHNKIKELIDVLILKKIKIYAESTKINMLPDNMLEIKTTLGGVVIEPKLVEIKKTNGHYNCYISGFKEHDPDLKALTHCKNINLNKGCEL